MLKKITRIFSGFVLSLAFIFPSVSTPAEYMQLYVNPPIKNKVETKKAELQSVTIAKDYIQLYVSPPTRNKVIHYIPVKQSPFGTTIDSGMYYDFYFHYQNPKPHSEKPITLIDFARWWRSLFEHEG